MDAPASSFIFLLSKPQNKCFSWSTEKDAEVGGVGGEGSVGTGDPLPLGDSVLGRGKFPSLRVMHRGSP